MRAVIQRVCNAAVTVDHQMISQIKHGLLVLVGAEEGDSVEDVNYIAQKCANLRIFEDEQEKMNLSVIDVKGEILLISQFTLCGDARKGRRPSFDSALEPQKANELYEQLLEALKEYDLGVFGGMFRAHMEVTLTNDGPVTILLDSRKRF